MATWQPLDPEQSICPYLGTRESLLQYYYVGEMTPTEYEELLNSGFRKFGRLVFQPNCAGCTECRPLRIRAADFQPSRSQRRAAARNAHLKVRIGPPDMTPAHLVLYDRYHIMQAERKNWPFHGSTSEAGYLLTLIDNFLDGVEISLYEDGVLRGVVLTDVTPHVVSAVYHFYDPDLVDQSLGTACLMQVFELAKSLGREYVHLGYFVNGCGSMFYKSQYRPCELLGPDGVWRPFGVADAANASA